MFLQIQKQGQSQGVLKGYISYCFGMQQPAVIVLYVSGDYPESRMKASGSDFRLNK